MAEIEAFTLGKAQLVFENLESSFQLLFQYFSLLSVFKFYQKQKVGQPSKFSREVLG